MTMIVDRSRKARGEIPLLLGSRGRSGGGGRHSKLWTVISRSRGKYRSAGNEARVDRPHLSRLRRCDFVLDYSSVKLIKRINKYLSLPINPADSLPVSGAYNGIIFHPYGTTIASDSSIDPVRAILLVSLEAFLITWNCFVDQRTTRRNGKQWTYL